jgi:hypothetical protein
MTTGDRILFTVLCLAFLGARGVCAEIQWKPAENVRVRLPAPEFTARLAKMNLNVRVTGDGSTRHIAVEFNGKTYRAEYVAKFHDAGTHIRLDGTLQAREPLPFDLTVKQSAQSEAWTDGDAILPLRDGELARQPVTAGEMATACWILGAGVTPAGSQLALPLAGLHHGDDVISCATDPYNGVQYRLSSAGIEVVTTFSGSLTPVSNETRVIEFGLHRDSTNELFATFYRTIPDVKPGPAWVHDIQLNYYDYIAETGKSLEPDLDALAKRIPEKSRKHVIVCLHGYYDYLGRYMYNSKTKQMDAAWKAYDNRSRLLPMTKAELHRRIRLVKDRGFRCGIYFFDSLAYEDAIPEFNRDWIWLNANGAPASWYYWQRRPDSKGHKNYMLNPAHPEVRQWFLDYTKALIAEYGRDLDALVWDETNGVEQRATVRLGRTPVEADRAMMRLVADVSRQVQAAWGEHPQLALLTSDNVDAHGPNRNIPYGLAAHGTYQDSHCDPKAWLPGKWPNYRNCLISCNWWPIKHRVWNRLAVEQYGLSQGVSNGYGDDQGPSEMPKDILDEIIARFLKQVESAP